MAGAYDHIFYHRQIGEQTQILKGSGDSKMIYLRLRKPVYSPAVEPDGASGWRKNTGNQIDESGFSGAVGSDNTGNLLGQDIKADMIRCLKATEVFREFLHFQ